VTTAAFLLVLGSAVLHASWNLLIKASGDRLVTAAGQVILGAVAFAPVLLFTGLPWGAMHWVVLSSVIHLLYGLSLVAAYERGDLSAVYPIARGTAPALVTLGATLFLGDSIGVAGVVAVALIVGGIVAIGLTGPTHHGVGWAVVTGVFITAYTLVDGHAVRSLDNAIDYTATLFLGNAVLYAVTVLGIRGVDAVRQGIRGDWWKQLLGGSASVLAYTMVLVAARLAPLGLVSAVRETSIIFGALAGWLILHEPLGGRRLMAATAIAAGLVVIAV
jgi:drug/metabolite transporter (DMT)-like permease